MEQALRKALGPDDGQALIPPNQQPQQAVEAGPVIHMGMRNRQYAQPQKVSWREGGEIAAIQQDRLGQV